MKPNTEILIRCGPNSLRIAARILETIAELQELRGELCLLCSSEYISRSGDILQVENIPLSNSSTDRQFFHLLQNGTKEVCEASDLHRAVFRLREKLNTIEIGWRT